MTTNELKISVCMATYNGKKYIREQMESILKQIKETDEVIVSDDGSSDNTIDIIRKMNDKRIHIYINELQHGYTKNFENSLNHATGDVFFISDQDDVWKENKVNECMEYLKKYDLVIHDATMTDNNLNIIAESHFKKYNIQFGFWRTFIRTRYTGACMAFTKKFYDMAIPFPKNQKLCPYDYWLAYLGEFYKRAIVINEQLIYYRRHEGTALNAGEYSTRPLLDRINTRLYLFKEVLGRKKKILAIK